MYPEEVRGEMRLSQPRTFPGHCCCDIDQVLEIMFNIARYIKDAGCTVTFGEILSVLEI